jgi:hypothetical protein
VVYEEEETYRRDSSCPRREPRLDDKDLRDLEALKRQTVYDKQLIEQVEARAAERAEKEKEILLAAQLKEVAVLQRQKQLDTQVNLIKATSSAVPKDRVTQTESRNTRDSRKRKAESSSSSEDILSLEVEKDDYCGTPVASTSTQSLFGPETPPKTPGKEWRKVNEELQRRSKQGKISSPKETKSSSRRDKTKDKPNPYVKLTKLDNDQLATLKTRSTRDKSSKAEAQARDKSPQPTTTRKRGITSPESSPEPPRRTSKSRVAHTPRPLSF